MILNKNYALKMDFIHVLYKKYQEICPKTAPIVNVHKIQKQWMFHIKHIQRHFIHIYLNLKKISSHSDL